MDGAYILDNLHIIRDQLINLLNGLTVIELIKDKESIEGTLADFAANLTSLRIELEKADH